MSEMANVLQKVSILVNSCDKYEDAWDPFFKILSVQWPECEYSIYLNTETKDYYCKYLDVKTIKTGTDSSWTERVRKALSVIDTEYILFFLEDFFLLDKVNNKLWIESLKFFDKHQEIGFLWFLQQNADKQAVYSNKKIENNYYIINRKCGYRVNATLALWKKKYFLQMLFRDTDPWAFELDATKFSSYSKLKPAYVDENATVFKYSIDPNLGYGITGGRWLIGNKELFEQYNLKVDFSRIGMFEKKMTYKDFKKKPQKSKKSLPKNPYKFVRRIGKLFLRSIKKRKAELLLIKEFKCNESAIFNDSNI